MADRHPAAVICLHWLSLLAVALLVVLGLGHDALESRSSRALVLDIHRQLGLLLFLLTAARLLLHRRLRLEFAADAKGHYRRLARFVHVLLYLLLLGLPLLGLCASQARGQTVTLLGLALPRLLARDREFADQLADFHEWGAWTLLALVGLHAAAALYHHYVRRDHTLLRMLPVCAASKSSFSRRL